MHLTDETLVLLKRLEGFRARVYRDSGGVWTIGYGHTRGVDAHTPVISEEQAMLLLREDAERAAEMVRRLVHVALTKHQFAALVSLVFNTGPAPLLGTMGRRLNAGDYKSAAKEFDRWVYAGGKKLPGLMRRRKIEREMFERR